MAADGKRFSAAIVAVVLAEIGTPCREVTNRLAFPFLRRLCCGVAERALCGGCRRRVEVKGGWATQQL